MVARLLPTTPKYPCKPSEIKTTNEYIIPPPQKEQQEELSMQRNAAWSLPLSSVFFFFARTVYSRPFSFFPPFRLSPCPF